jgi:hypothetical protein
LRRSLVALGVFLALAVTVMSGCSGGASRVERLDAISLTYHDNASGVEEAASFLEPLALLDIDEQETMVALQGSLRDCAAAVAEAKVSLDEMAGYDYSGELESLGEKVIGYQIECQACLDELEASCAYLQSLTDSLEPFVRVRAELPELSSTASLNPYLQTLRELLAACESAIQSMSALTPTPVLAEYHALMQELFQMVREVLKDYIAIAEGSGNPQDLTGNQDVIRYLALKGRYQQLVPGLYERMRISGLDPYMEQVELEINRLYLDGS